MNLAEVRHLLPQTVRDIADLIGIASTLKLVEELGGTTWPVSKNQNRLGEIRFQALAEVVGVDAADKLTARWGGDLLYIPRCADAVRHLRDVDICRQFDELSRTLGSNGAVAALSRQFKLSDRRVWEILKATDTSSQGDRQDGLF